MDEHSGFRDASIRRWERSAPGWTRERERFQQVAIGISERMVAAVAPEPGERVLELAAGLGDTGFLAAERIGPSGSLVTSDVAEAMLDGARARAAELGLENVEFRRLDAEWIDLPTASVDAALCRFGYMLLADPVAALRETRRVLRPGGRVALAIWDVPEANPWATVTGPALERHGLADPQGRGGPGLFALAPEERVVTAIMDAGFLDATVEPVPVEYRHPDADDFWELRRSLSPPFADTIDELDADTRAAVRADVDRALEPHTGPGGEIVLAGRALVARADA